MNDATLLRTEVSLLRSEIERLRRVMSAADHVERCADPSEYPDELVVDLWAMQALRDALRDARESQ